MIPPQTPQALIALIEQWRENVNAIGPYLEGAAFEQCANQLEAALALVPRPQEAEHEAIYRERDSDGAGHRGTRDGGATDRGRGTTESDQAAGWAGDSNVHVLNPKEAALVPRPVSSPLLEFVQRVAANELCDDATKQDECQLESGPYCGTHDYFIQSIVEEARALLNASGSPPDVHAGEPTKQP